MGAASSNLVPGWEEHITQFRNEAAVTGSNQAIWPPPPDHQSQPHLQETPFLPTGSTNWADPQSPSVIPDSALAPEARLARNKHIFLTFIRLMNDPHYHGLYQEAVHSQHKELTLNFTGDGILHKAQLTRYFLHLFPNPNVQVKHCLAEQDEVMAWCVYTLQARGIAGTEMRYCCHSRVVDGLIRETNIIFDWEPLRRGMPA
ncbi:hypothetical protein G7K_4880-t1 [Saitoella complicata NRRL Y-17804]|uniref:SnoaL-like domain-containing protein n=1 Tax=Saitoella complicata (strain BCRC 22490 / CBS 7301 / JCM 7358 / NBRC 10748 / NRRL Y-17804) TaxID=698492 RepID=A0A0E9NLN7_SAICN|nr:hypothetical protein G7K_4880-t1 [Saitoella complicata NRRL Y-17804]